MIEEAQTLGRTVQSEWSKEKLVLAEAFLIQRSVICVRVKGAVSEATAITAAFGATETVDAGLDGEFGFLTGRMTEKEYQACADKTEGILSMLRVREK